MSFNVAINGYGRIGRCILRAIFEDNRLQDFNIVAINDLSGIATTAHLTRYDSTHGRFNKEVSVEGDYLIIDGKPIFVAATRNPEELPWAELKVDLVFECTGHFTQRATAAKHLTAGAKKVLISAPAKDVDATIVFGVNDEILKASDTIVSNASCTTNCLAPLCQPLQEHLGIERGFINTVHAFTKDQLLLDGSHKDLRRARAASESIIPTKTGAAEALGLVLPSLAGKLDGFAMRVPTVNVSSVDLTFLASRKTSVEEVNTILKNAKSTVLDVTEEPLVSCDFNHTKASATVDLPLTKVLDNLVKVVAWYDNEWGFANRMLDTAALMLRF